MTTTKTATKTTNILQWQQFEFSLKTDGPVRNWPSSESFLNLSDFEYWKFLSSFLDVSLNWRCIYHWGTSCVFFVDISQLVLWNNASVYAIHPFFIRKLALIFVVGFSENRFLNQDLQERTKSSAKIILFSIIWVGATLSV